MSIPAGTMNTKAPPGTTGRGFCCRTDAHPPMTPRRSPRMAAEQSAPAACRAGGPLVLDESELAGVTG